MSRRQSCWRYSPASFIFTLHVCYIYFYSDNCCLRHFRSYILSIIPIEMRPSQKDRVQKTKSNVCRLTENYVNQEFCCPPGKYVLLNRDEIDHRVIVKVRFLLRSSLGRRFQFDIPNIFLAAAFGSIKISFCNRRAFCENSSFRDGKTKNQKEISDLIACRCRWS